MSSLMSHITRALRSLSPFHFARGTVAPDPAHLYPQRRIFNQPSTRHTDVLEMLRTDEDFQALLWEVRGEYMFQVAICDDQIRVNFFKVEYDNGDRGLVSTYHGKWQSEGVFNFDLSDKLQQDVFNYYWPSTFSKNIKLITYHSPGRFYHPDDVRISYMRDLTAEELLMVDVMCSNQVKSTPTVSSEFELRNLPGGRFRGDIGFD